MKKKILLFFIVGVLTIIFTPIFGHLYVKFFGPVYGGFFWVSSSSTLEGFIFSFLFFGSLLSWLFVEKDKKKYWLYYTLPLLILMLLLGAFEELIIGIGLVIIGWLLAQMILLFRRTGK